MGCCQLRGSGQSVERCVRATGCPHRIQLERSYSRLPGFWAAVRPPPPPLAPGGRLPRVVPQVGAGLGRPRLRRWPTWSDGCGVTVRMLRRRRWARMAPEEYARSARTARGRVRGPPGPLRGTRMPEITVSKAGASPAWPAVRVKARGHARPSAARRTFVLDPRGDVEACSSPSPAYPQPPVSPHSEQQPRDGAEPQTHWGWHPAQLPLPSGTHQRTSDRWHPVHNLGSRTRPGAVGRVSMALYPCLKPLGPRPDARQHVGGPPDWRGPSLPCLRRERAGGSGNRGIAAPGSGLSQGLFRDFQLCQRDFRGTISRANR